MLFFSDFYRAISHQDGASRSFEHFGKVRLQGCRLNILQERANHLDHREEKLRDGFELKKSRKRALSRDSTQPYNESP